MRKASGGRPSPAMKVLSPDNAPGSAGLLRSGFRRLGAKAVGPRPQIRRQLGKPAGTEKPGIAHQGLDRVRMAFREHLFADDQAALIHLTGQLVPALLLIKAPLTP